MPAATLTLFKTFFDLCRLRLRPQDLPASQVLLRSVLVAYFLVSAATALTSLPLAPSLVGALVDVGLLGLLTGLALRARAVPERYTQTLTALAGTGTVLGLLALPVLAGMSAASTGPGLQALLSNLWLILLIWNLVVMGHIARHALSVSLPAGLAVAFLYLLVMLGVYALLPGAGTA